MVAWWLPWALIAFVYLLFNKDSRADTSRWGNRLRVLSAIVLACSSGRFLPSRIVWAWHIGFAAILIFVIIGAVVFINAYLVGDQDNQKRKTRELFHRWSRVVAWAMVGSVMLRIG